MEQRELESYRGRIDFILANPPASEGDDGFGCRRRVLKEGKDFLAEGGVVFLNISSQYGAERIDRLCQEALGFRHQGVLSSTDWVPFDLGRSDLLECLELYAAEERKGDLEFAFKAPGGGEAMIDARSALAFFHRTGEGPLTKWQVHLFRLET